MDEEVVPAVTVEVTDHGACARDHRHPVGEQASAAEHGAGGEVQPPVGPAPLGHGTPLETRRASGWSADAFG